jgi:hypothetical protein
MPVIAPWIADHAPTADEVVKTVVCLAMDSKRGAAPLDEVVEMR